MKNGGLHILSMALFATVVMAVKPSLAEENLVLEEQIPVIEDTNSQFFHPNEQLTEIKTIERPTCDSPEFYAKALATIQEYTESIPAASTLSKRKKALILANINGFHQVELAGFTSDTDFNTANALITIKVNKKIKEDDMLLCQENSKAAERLYIIAYPYADNYMAHIINLNKTSDNYQDITFIYP